MTRPVRTTQDPPQHTPTLVLADRYRVFEVLGRGGMASVHRGHDERLDRPVAVKLLHDHLADDRRVRERFRREAVAAARLNHPGVVAVYDHWRGGAADPPYLVMELVEGGSVRDVLAARRSLTPGQALALLRPAMVGLADAHRRGIVHRDVTPANVLVGRDGASKLGDFGLARAAAESTSTFPEGVVGSPHYMSPEAVRGEPLDARADVYSLGCVLYECLTGSTPFDGSTPQAVAMRHGTEPVPPPSSRAPDLPAALDDVVATACAVAPGDRFEDAAAFVRALDEAVPEGPEAIDLRIPGRDLHVDPVHATRTLDDDPITVAVATAEPEPRRSRWLWSLAVLVALAVAAGGGWLTYDRVVAPVTEVPGVVGDPLADARGALEEAGFVVAVSDRRVHSREVPADAVLSVTPDTPVRRGTTVELVVSLGPRSEPLPTLDGGTVEDARALVDGLGLDLTVTTVDGFHDDAPVGTVLASTPAAGVRVEEGGEVELVVSAGPAPVDVPQVVGQGQAAATALLVEAGLEVEVTDELYDDEVPDGAVIAVTPAAGEILRRGDEVQLVVSRGPAPVEVPDVRGMAEADAVAQLEELGFEVAVEYVPRILPLSLGTVDEQAPSPGQVRLRGTTVRLFVWELA